MGKDENPTRHPLHQGIPSSGKNEFPHFPRERAISLSRSYGSMHPEKIHAGVLMLVA
jgi:hypothetical protein